MKRLVPATVILLIIITLCFASNIVVQTNCNKLATDIEDFYQKNISSDTLQQNWSDSKEKLSIFVNHHFLDEITLYIGQLCVSDSDIKSPEFETIRHNILTIISMIKKEQQFSAHSFY